MSCFGRQSNNHGREWENIYDENDKSNME